MSKRVQIMINILLTESLSGVSAALEISGSVDRREVTVIGGRAERAGTLLLLCYE